MMKEDVDNPEGMPIGPVVTAGGALFIGATVRDKKKRAFDKSTGKLLWEMSLPFSACATPGTYEIDGRQ